MAELTEPLNRILGILSGEKSDGAGTFPRRNVQCRVLSEPLWTSYGDVPIETAAGLHAAHERRTTVEVQIVMEVR